MGGTSADVALIRDFQADIAFERDVAGFPLRLPSVDIETVGAGGGSIAWFDRDGLLKAGPISAGAAPGPHAMDWAAISLPSPTPICCSDVFPRADYSMEKWVSMSN